MLFFYRAPRAVRWVNKHKVNTDLSPKEDAGSFYLNKLQINDRE